MSTTTNPRARLSRRLVSLAFAAALAGAPACNFVPSFDPESVLSSVRILAVRADKPYAKPGDTVHLDVLAVDGREQQPEPMRVFWIPAACTNPHNGAPTSCYGGFAKAFHAGQDVTPLLHEGASLSVSVPDDALAESAPGLPRSYGSMFVFQMACAGRVRYLGPNDQQPTAVPFGCFDASGKQLGVDDFVFSFASVFVFAQLTNENPVLDGLTLDSQPVDLDAGITVDRCKTQDAKKCPSALLDAVAPESDQEIDPIATAEFAAEGEQEGVAPLVPIIVKERVWVSYYVTLGTVRAGAKQLYDPTQGKAESSTAPYQASRAAGEGTLFAVIRDSRAGVDWLEVPIHVQ